MRFLTLAAALLLSSCAKEEPPPPGIPAGTFASGERDGLCVSGLAGSQRGGFVVYGPGDTNCSASGRIEQAGGSWQLVPEGEGDCRIPLQVDGGTIALGRGAPSCAYYCAPGVTFEGKSFGRIEWNSRQVTDVAGDPLC
jgi:hypothetical protein